MGYLYAKVLGVVAECRKDYDEAWRQLEEVRSIYEQLGDEIGLANVLLSLGWVAESKNNLQQARLLYEEAIRRFGAVGDLGGFVNAAKALAVLEERLNEDKQALELALEALDISKRLGRKKVVEEMRALVERLEGKLSADR